MIQKKNSAWIPRALPELRSSTGWPPPGPPRSSSPRSKPRSPRTRKPGARPPPPHPRRHHGARRAGLQRPIPRRDGGERIADLRPRRGAVGRRQRERRRRVDRLLPFFFFKQKTAYELIW